MAGISNRWLLAIALLVLPFSCTKEVEGGPEELHGEYDPVVRFGLETYMGPSNLQTRTTYAGDDKTLLLNSVRYERINWNVDPDSSDPSTKADTLRVISEQNFTKNNKKVVDYIPVKINGITNKDGLINSEADASPVGGNDADNLYWTVSKDPRYFYAVYPSPARTTPDKYEPKLTVNDPDTSEHSLTISGAIPRNQKYVGIKSSGKVVEYLPDMADAYMYAAAKVPVANAGYKKVPLKFKPLFSAVKLLVTASDAGAENYRLKRVDLRTDLFYSDLHQSDPARVNAPTEGTALNGPFTAKFTPETTDNKTPAYTGDFTVTSQPALNTVQDTVYKRLTIRIPEADRVWLGDDTVKVTFLALPIDHTVMTVVYTFEKKDDSGNLVLDEEGKPVEVIRYLSLQRKTDNDSNTGTGNEFTGRDWFTLPAANKLYVRSDVPDIRYVFEVETQGNFPRTWAPGSPKPAGKPGFFEAKDFYSVASYRDSSGVLQPLRWKVTGYKEGGTGQTEYKMSQKPGWLNIRGDDPWTATHPFDVEPVTFTDPWVNPQGQGTKMKDPVVKNGITIGYRDFDPYAAQFYDAGAPNNDAGYPRKWDWDDPVAYNYMDAGGSFFYSNPHGAKPGFTGGAGEAYAFDLSSHDILGNLYPGLKNGDLGTTANCYVVSAPGWYRFPAVYGCAIQGGVDNSKSYTGSAGEENILHSFLDYQEASITDAWISYPLKSADVVWDDANHMVARWSTKTSRAPRGAFCKEHEGRQYVYFYVDDIAQGNAVVAAKDASGTVVWSWHIWAVTKPAEYLRVVRLQGNLKSVNERPSWGNVNNWRSIYEIEGLDTYFWQYADLGQHGKEGGTVDPRYCDVEFTQYFKGKVVKKIVRRFLQSGVMDSADIAPLYQWGRKDPMRSDQNPATVDIPTQWYNAPDQNLHNTIQHPEIMYLGNNQRVAQGHRYDNLWNTNVDTRVTQGTSNNSVGGSRERKVEKTIYDPSPAGYSMPDMYAYSGLNPWGPINQVLVPYNPHGIVDPQFYNKPLSQLGYSGPAYTDYTNGGLNDPAYIDAKNGVAKNPSSTFNTHPSEPDRLVPLGYIDFYCEYDESATYRRNQDPDKVIRFYVTGRRNGNAGGGKRQWQIGDSGTDISGMYWTSEPAAYDSNTALFGRALWFAGPDAKPNHGYRWFLNPVAGGANSEPKWQRTHALAVRPMRQ